MDTFSWSEYRRQQQLQLQQQRQQDPQQRQELASERLHECCEALRQQFHVTEAELVELLEMEREWFAGDATYQVMIFDQS